MSVLIVGSIGIDSVKTPFGEASDVLGGSAVYASVSSSFFNKAFIISVVGSDFPDEYMELLKSYEIDITGVEKIPGQTFRWKGYYTYELNEAKTLETQLNVLSEFDPVLPDSYRNLQDPHIFLANIDPDLQIKVLDQIKNPELVVLDTMNYWIENKPESLKEAMSKVDVMVLNDGEARELTGEPNLVKASTKIRELGPKRVIIKKGEHGALMFSDDSIFSAPAYPLEFIFDPTGAGDTFAGGLIGYLSDVHGNKEEDYRKAVIFGSAMASFVVEDFSLERMKILTWDDIKERYYQFKTLSHFELI
ncbi:TPA: sugar kinase [bacterium]|nr:sugar kinase [bacterium]